MQIAGIDAEGLQFGVADHAVAIGVVPDQRCDAAPAAQGGGILLQQGEQRIGLARAGAVAGVAGQQDRQGGGAGSGHALAEAATGIEAHPQGTGLGQAGAPGHRGAAAGAQAFEAHREIEIEAVAAGGGVAAAAGAQQQQGPLHQRTGDHRIGPLDHALQQQRFLAAIAIAIAGGEAADHHRFLAGQGQGVGITDIDLHELTLRGRAGEQIQAGDQAVGSGACRHLLQLSRDYLLTVGKIAEGVALTDQRQGQNVEAGRQVELRVSVGGRQWGPEQRGGVEAQQLQGAIGPAADRLAISADLQQLAIGLGHQPLPLCGDQPLGALGLAITHHDRLINGGE